MVSKEVALEVAAFLDSAPARRLEAPDATVRALAEAFLDACYAELGKAPRHLDAQDLQAVLTESMPRRFAPRDAAVEHAPAVLAALLDHLESAHVVTQAFELRRALEPAARDLVNAVRSGRAPGGHAPPRDDPFVHGASKLGRNDPCSCGSGKKYKKCHGKNA